MLQTQDKIFTNLYKAHSPDLASAKIRGDWDKTKSLITVLIHLKLNSHSQRSFMNPDVKALKGP